MVYRYVCSYLRIDTKMNTEADLLIQGNILYAGFNLISYKTPQDKTSQEIKQNLLISTNETSYNCKFGTPPDYHCGIQSSYAIFLPSNITGISHFHQINSSHIVVIPLNQNCLRIFERTFDKLTTKDTIIGDCYSRGNRDGSNPLFDRPSQSISDNRNREILYVIDQHNKEIRMVNIVDRMVGSVELQLRFGDKYSQITQAENATFYISVEAALSTYIMSFDLIPPKNASSKYFLTLKRLRFAIQQVFSVFSHFSKLRRMTWISNHTLMFVEEQSRDTDVMILKFLNFSAQTQGYINISSPLWASFEIDKNLSRPHFKYPSYYTWVNDSIYITSLTSAYRLTRQQLQLVISNQEKKTGLDFYWQTSKYLWRMKGAEGKKEK